MRVYTVEEVTRHNQRQDLWIIIHGKVYDITKFLEKHPGGEEVLLELGGQDATQCFDEVGHSAEAMLLRDTFQIGVIGEATEERPNEPTVGTIKETPMIDNDSVEELQEVIRLDYLATIIALHVVVYIILCYIQY